jgi:hypothetical protein
MIATGGDESFVMLTIIPKQAVAVHVILLIVGLAAGVAMDAVAGGPTPHVPVSREGLEIHPEERI